jgi:multicomponent Na+:H+ antiporter subunit F
MTGLTGQVLIFVMIFLGILIGFCLLRGILGPRFTDRMVAINIIGLKTIMLVAALSVYLNQSYLLDVCLIYAIISFLTVVVLNNAYVFMYNKKQSLKNGEGLDGSDD